MSTSTLTQGILGAGATSPAQVSSTSNPFSNLNLSSTQSSEIQSILQDSQGQSFAQVQSQINSVLTPAQQSTLLSDSHKMGTAHRHGANSTGTSNSLDSGNDAFGVASASSAAGSTAAPSSIFQSGASAADQDELSLLDQLTASTSSATTQASNPFSLIAANYAMQSQLQPLNL